MGRVDAINTGLISTEAGTASGGRFSALGGVLGNIRNRFSGGISRSRLKEENETAALLQNLQVERVCPDDLGGVEAIYRQGTFSDEAMRLYSKGNKSLILKEQDEGKGFLETFDAESVRGQWDKDFGSPNHVPVRVADIRTGNLLGYFDGYANVGDARKHMQDVYEYVNTIDGLTDPTESRLIDHPNSVARVGTIGVAPDCQGKGIGKILMYSWILRLLNELEPRENGDGHIVTSFRFNQFYPVNHEAVPHSSEHFGDILNNAPSSRFFSKYAFKTIGFHYNPFERAGVKFNSQWLHEMKSLYELAIIAHKFVVDLYKKHDVSLPQEWERLWQDAYKKHGIGEHSNGRLVASTK